MKNNNIPVKETSNVQITKPSPLKDIKESLLEFWEEFSKIKYGVAGLVLLVAFFLLMIIEPFIIPFPEAGDKWKDITYWDSNPRNAAPVWVNWFTTNKRAPHQFLSDPDWVVDEKSQFKIMRGSFTYNYSYDVPPSELTLRTSGKGNIRFNVSLIRPDGKEIELLEDNLRSNKPAEIKIPLSKDAVRKAYDFGKDFESKENLNVITQYMVKPYKVFFSRAEEGILANPQPLKGEYKINIEAVAFGKDAYIEKPRLIVSGRVFGLLGTDDSKRDVWSGVIVGIKWAMLIGLMTAFISVSIGVIYGVTSSYFGGWIDSLMMRIFEVFVSVPLLPVLIVLSAVFKPSIWLLIIMMSVFFWTGSVRTVRSMGLQIKEETYIEAARALNASHMRIIFKHMVPQLIPYAFASMALSVPSAIVYEASISLLGLGDGSIVTWGQILHDAMHGGAILQGLWWWVVPPGLAIAVVSMTFAFIGFSMDKILNPKLKTR